MALPLLNENELSEQLQVSVSTIRRWRLLKRGPRYVKLGFTVRYRPEDVAAWLNNQPTGGDPGQSKTKRENR